MPALFDGVMQRAISAGSERVARQLSGRKDNTEQRGEGKQSQNTSSDSSAGCMLMRKGNFGLQEIR